MHRVIKYVFYDLLRSRFVLWYAAFLLASSTAIFLIESDPGKVALSLLNVVMMVLPLISIVFTTIHLFNSREFIELMLAQPVDRKSVILAEYISVATSLCIACLLGIGVPSLLFATGEMMLSLLTTGILLTLVFVSLAFLTFVLTRDKSKAIGLSLLFWFHTSLIHDTLLLWVVYSFSDYPLEHLTITLIALNPIDLARINVLLQLDVSALMGYTGAFYKNFFGSLLGQLFSLVVLTVWALIPIWAAIRMFMRKDL